MATQESDTNSSSSDLNSNVESNETNEPTKAAATNSSPKAENESSSEPVEEEREPAHFEDWNLAPTLMRALGDMGYDRPMPVQEAVFTTLTDGDDLMVQSRTGSGKTAAFGIPIAQRLSGGKKGVQSLILAPTRELALQVAKEIEKIVAHMDVSVVPIYGGAPIGPQIQQLEAGGQIVAGTPGRVLDHIRRGTMDTSGIIMLVLDECDEMLSMGFQEEIENIISTLPGKENRQTLLFSATIPKEIERIGRRHMRNPEMLSLSSDSIGAELIDHYYYVVSGMARNRDLLKLMKSEKPDSAIIFCNTRDETNTVARYLRKNGYDAEALSSDLSQADRERVMGRMRDKNLNFLVATDIAARGIDISELSHVINYTFPGSPEVYVHRSGRTGRAGKEGTALSLVGPREIGAFYYLKLIYKIIPTERELPTTDEMASIEEGETYEKVIAMVEGEPRKESLALAKRLWQSREGERVVALLLETLLANSSESRKARPEARRVDSTASSLAAAAAPPLAAAPAPAPSHEEETTREERPRRKRRRRERTQEQPLDAKVESTEVESIRSEATTAGSGSETKTDAETETKADTGGETEISAVTETEIKAETGAVIKTEAETEIKTEAGTEIQSDTGAEIQSDTGAVIQFDTGAETKVSESDATAKPTRKRRRRRGQVAESVLAAAESPAALVAQETSESDAARSRHADSEPVVVPATLHEEVEPEKSTEEISVAASVESNPSPTKKRRRRRGAAEEVAMSQPETVADASESSEDEATKTSKATTKPAASKASKRRARKPRTEAGSHGEFWEAWAESKQEPTSSPKVEEIAVEAAVETTLESDEAEKPTKRRRRRRKGGRDREEEENTSEDAIESTSSDVGSTEGDTAEESQVVAPSNTTTRLFVNIGKREDADVEAIREFLGEALGDSAGELGSITLRNTHCYVRVPEQLVDTLIEACSGLVFEEREVVVERARSRR